MSTKIYSAYKIKEGVNFTQLMQINYQIKEQIVTCFVNKVSLILATKVNKIMNNLEESKCNDKFSESVRALIERIINNKDYPHPEKNLYHRLYDDLKDSLKDMYGFNKAEIVYIPHNDDIFAMFFGSYEYETYVANNDNFTDYHYQNQSDKPDNITDEEWEQREKDWEEAIGPDYVPINHGMLFTFLDHDSYDIERKLSEAFESAMEKVEEIKAKKQKG